MISIASRSGEPVLQRDVYVRLKQDIFDFCMPPGQRYSEHELAASLGVSRTPLRLALHVLAREGYLVRVAGHASWQVKPFDLDYYEDLYDFRTEIEAIAVERLCRAPSLAALGPLRTYWQSTKARKTRDYQEVARQDELLHQTLVTLSGNGAMLRSFDDLTDRIRIIRRLDFVDPLRIAAAFREHAGILERVLARDAAGAAALVRKHIGASRVEIRKITLHRVALATARAAASASLRRA